MLEEITLWPNKLKEGLDLANNFYFKHGGQLSKKYKKIIFVGMGGSGIAGRIIKTFLDKKCSIPSFVVDTPELPAFVDADTLAIVVSYSGNTWETVVAFQALVDRFIPTVVLSHGGRIAEIAEQKNIPFILLPTSKTPRTALGNILGVLLGLFDLMGIIEGKKILSIFDKHLALYLPKFEEDTTCFNDFLNRANGCEMFHIFGVSGDSAAFAYRAQTQFNENSKVYSVTSTFPELNHNLLVGFTGCNKKPFVLVFETDFIPAHMSAAVEVTCELLRENGVILYNPALLGDTWEAQLFHIILWADFASCYLARAKKVDAEAVVLIEKLKKRLEEKK